MKSHPLAKIQDLTDISTVCKLHAEGKSAREIARALSSQSGVKYYHRNVLAIINNPANNELIQKHRNIYLSDPFVVDLSHKRVRLEDLNRERIRIIRTIEALCGNGDIIGEKKVFKYLSLVKRLIEIEIAGKDEIEKKPDMLNIFMPRTAYSDLTPEELSEELRKVDEEILQGKTAELKQLVPINTSEREKEDMGPQKDEGRVSNKN